MEGWSEQALAGSFTKIIKLVNKKHLPKKRIKNRLERHLNQAQAAKEHTSRNEARIIYRMRQYLKKRFVFRDHPTVTCSFTNPQEMENLDCERSLSSTACGGDHSQYGPEFAFGHVFPKLESPLRKQPIGIAKVAVGGTQIYANWMKDNKDDPDNYWYALVDAIKAANGTLEGFVWFQGENDSFDEWNGVNYLTHLTQFVKDVREEIIATSSSKFASVSDIPVVIVEMGYWIDGLGPKRFGQNVIDAQNSFVANDDNAILVKTGAGDDDMNLSGFYHYDAASQLIIGRRIAKAMARILLENSDDEEYENTS